MSTRHQRIADTELNEKHTRILTCLLQQPGNKYCADCKKKDPRWASWNLGIFVCIRCSGTHRSMGTHISKVKSVDLDTWIPEQVDNMVKWGNERANVYWEANLTNQERPTDHTIDQWIKTKYELKKWAQKDSQPDPSAIELPLQPTLSVEEIQRQEKQLQIEEEEEKRRKKEKRLTNPTAELDLFFTSSISSPLPKVREQVVTPPKPTITTTTTTTPTTTTTTSKLSKSYVNTNNTNNNTNTTSETNTTPLVVSPSTSYVNNMSSFQQQLSSLSMGMPSSGFIPRAPPGATSNWENIIGKSSKTNKPPVNRR